MLENFQIQNGVLLKYFGADPNVEIPNEVTKIGDHAFEGCEFIKSICIPENVEEIGVSAFENCMNLEQITFASNSKLKIISERAFCGCAFKELIFPDSVTQIREGAFMPCGELKKLVLPCNLTYIGESAFEGCENLPEVFIPLSVKRIDSLAFAYANNMTAYVEAPEKPSGWSDVWNCDEFPCKVVWGQKRKTSEVIDSLSFAEKAAANTSTNSIQSQTLRMNCTGVPEEKSVSASINTQISSVPQNQFLTKHKTTIKIVAIVTGILWVLLGFANALLPVFFSRWDSRMVDIQNYLTIAAVVIGLIFFTACIILLIQRKKMKKYNFSSEGNAVNVSNGRDGVAQNKSLNTSQSFVNKNISSQKPITGNQEQVKKDKIVKAAWILSACIVVLYIVAVLCLFLTKNTAWGGLLIVVVLFSIISGIILYGRAIRLEDRYCPKCGAQVRRTRTFLERRAGRTDNWANGSLRTKYVSEYYMTWDCPECGWQKENTVTKDAGTFTEYPDGHVHDQVQEPKRDFDTGYPENDKTLAFSPETRLKRYKVKKWSYAVMGIVMLLLAISGFIITVSYNPGNKISEDLKLAWEKAFSYESFQNVTITTTYENETSIVKIDDGLVYVVYYDESGLSEEITEELTYDMLNQIAIFDFKDKYDKAIYDETEECYYIGSEDNKAKIVIEQEQVQSIIVTQYDTVVVSIEYSDYGTTEIPLP